MELELDPKKLEIRKIKEWLFEYAAKFGMAQALKEIANKHNDMWSEDHCEISYFYPLLHTTRNIVCKRDLDNYPKAINAIDSLYDQLFQYINNKTYVKLMAALKLLVLFDMLEKDDLNILQTLNSYFPTSGFRHSKADDHTTKKLQLAYVDFRKFFLTLISRPSYKKLYFETRYEKEYGDKFMKNLKTLMDEFAQSILDCTCPTIIERLISNPPDEHLKQEISAFNSTMFAVFLENLEGFETLNEAKIIYLLNLFTCLYEESNITLSSQRPALVDILNSSRSSPSADAGISDLIQSSIDLERCPEQRRATRTRFGSPREKLKKNSNKNNNNYISNKMNSLSVEPSCFSVDTPAVTNDRKGKEIADDVTVVNNHMNDEINSLSAEPSCFTADTPIVTSHGSERTVDFSSSFENYLTESLMNGQLMNGQCIPGAIHSAEGVGPCTDGCDPNVASQESASSVCETEDTSPPSSRELPFFSSSDVSAAGDKVDSVLKICNDDDNDNNNDDEDDGDDDDGGAVESSGIEEKSSTPSETMEPHGSKRSLKRKRTNMSSARSNMSSASSSSSTCSPLPKRMKLMLSCQNGDEIKENDRIETFCHDDHQVNAKLCDETGLVDSPTSNDFNAEKELVSKSHNHQGRIDHTFNRRSTSPMELSDCRVVDEFVDADPAVNEDNSCNISANYLNESNMESYGPCDDDEEEDEDTDDYTINDDRKKHDSISGRCDSWIDEHTFVHEVSCLLVDKSLQVSVGNDESVIGKESFVHVDEDNGIDGEEGYLVLDEVTPTHEITPRNASGCTPPVSDAPSPTQYHSFNKQSNYGSCSNSSDVKSSQETFCTCCTQSQVQQLTQNLLNDEDDLGKETVKPDDNSNVHDDGWDGFFRQITQNIQNRSPPSTVGSYVSDSEPETLRGLDLLSEVGSIQLQRMTTAHVVLFQKRVAYTYDGYTYTLWS